MRRFNWRGRWHCRWRNRKIIINYQTKNKGLKMKNYHNKLAGLLACCAIISPTLAHAEMVNYKKMTPPLEVRNFKNYEHREPCQQYKPMPSTLSKTSDRCIDGAITTPDQTSELMPVYATYVIYFDFDKSGINPSQQQIIETLIRDVNTSHPKQITVIGHTDTAGSAAYNQALSAKRADTVSKALASRNVSSFYLNESALGEQDLAVPTPDDTKLSTNRRVVIQFRK
jgi:outer membrane protein OmpA-like peptidoglycan-associated protein